MIDNQELKQAEAYIDKLMLLIEACGTLDSEEND